MAAKSIVTVNEYGKIQLRLKEIMDKKKMTRNYLARATNTRFEVINKWYNNEVEKMDLDILARICYVLDCKPSSLLKYEDNKSKPPVKRVVCKSPIRA
jgi:putative transcriptional regulator